MAWRGEDGAEDGARPAVDAAAGDGPGADTDPAVRVRRLVSRHERFGKPPAAAREWVHRSDEVNARRVLATRAAADLVVDLDRLA